MRIFENKSQLPANYFSHRINQDLKHVFTLLGYIPGKLEESAIELLAITDNIKAVESYISGLYRVPQTLREFAINIARRLNELGLLENIINVELDMKDRLAVFYLDGKTDKVYQFRDIAKSIGYPLEILKLEKFKDDPLKMYVLKFKFEQAATDQPAEPEKRIPVPEEEMKFYFTCPNDGTEFEIEIKPAEEELKPVEPEKPGETPKESIQVECKLCGYTETLYIPVINDSICAEIQKKLNVCNESARMIIYDYKKTKDPIFVMRKYSLLPEHIQAIHNVLQEDIEQDEEINLCPICNGVAFNKDEKLECQNCSYVFVEDVPIEPGDSFKDLPMEPEKLAKELISRATGQKPPYRVSDLVTIKKLEQQCLYCDGVLTEAGATWCTVCGYIFTEEGHPPVIQICDEGYIFDPMLGKCVREEEFGKAGGVTA